MGGLHGMMRYSHDEILDMNNDAFDRLLDVLQNSKGTTHEETEAANAAAKVATNGSNRNRAMTQIDKPAIDPDLLKAANVAQAEAAVSDSDSIRSSGVKVLGENGELTEWRKSSSSASISQDSGSSESINVNPSIDADSDSDPNLRSATILDQFTVVNAATPSPQPLTAQEKFLSSGTTFTNVLARVKPRKTPSMCLQNPSACETKAD